MSLQTMPHLQRMDFFGTGDLNRGFTDAWYDKNCFQRQQDMQPKSSLRSTLPP